MPAGTARRVARDLLIGVAASAVVLWVTFSASADTLHILTLVTTVAILIWFATVDPRRLVDQHGRPNGLLFLLAAMGMAILITGARFLGGATILLVVVLGAAAVVIGVTRAVRHGMR